MEYVTVAGKRASFSLGIRERGPDDTFALSWDSASKMPVDRYPTALDVTIMAQAICVTGFATMVRARYPRAPLAVHLG